MAEVHTYSPEGLLALLSLWDCGQEESPGRSRVFSDSEETQCKCPLFPGAVWTVAKTPPDAAGHWLSLDQHFLPPVAQMRCPLTQRLHWKWPQRTEEVQVYLGPAVWTEWAVGLSAKHQGQSSGGEPCAFWLFQGELGVHSSPEALENSQVSICL